MRSRRQTAWSMAQPSLWWRFISAAYFACVSRLTSLMASNRVSVVFVQGICAFTQWIIISPIKLCSVSKHYATFWTVCITNLHLHKRTVKSNAIHAKTSIPVSGRGFWTDERDSWTDGWPAAKGENKSRLYRRLITTSTKTRHLRQLAIVLFIVRWIFILPSFYAFEFQLTCF